MFLTNVTIIPNMYHDKKKAKAWRLSQSLSVHLRNLGPSLPIFHCHSIAIGWLTHQGVCIHKPALPGDGGTWPFPTRAICSAKMLWSSVVEPNPNSVMFELTKVPINPCIFVDSLSRNPCVISLTTWHRRLIASSYPALGPIRPQYEARRLPLLQQRGRGFCPSAPQQRHKEITAHSAHGTRKHAIGPWSARGVNIVQIPPRMLALP